MFCSLVELPFPSLGRDASVWRLGDSVELGEGKSEEGVRPCHREKRTDCPVVCSTSWTPSCSRLLATEDVPECGPTGRLLLNPN